MVGAVALGTHCNSLFSSMSVSQDLVTIQYALRVMCCTHMYVQLNRIAQHSEQVNTLRGIRKHNFTLGYFNRTTHPAVCISRTWRYINHVFHVFFTLVISTVASVSGMAGFANMLTESKESLIAVTTPFVTIFRLMRALLSPSYGKSLLLLSREINSFLSV